MQEKNIQVFVQMAYAYLFNEVNSGCNNFTEDDLAISNFSFAEKNNTWTYIIISQLGEKLTDKQIYELNKISNSL